MTIFGAVLISIALCVGLQVARHLFTRRHHRGGHARADLMYSPYTLADRVEKEREQQNHQQSPAGRHALADRSYPFDSVTLSGELPLLSGYAVQTMSRDHRHDTATNQDSHSPHR